MRTTQYIGLNKFATDYLSKAISTEQYEMTEGMFGEPVTGTIYHMPPPKGPNKALVCKEVVQATPWSSGMMIFTHIEATLVKGSGQELNHGTWFSWISDPSVSDMEYDVETGRMYV